MSYLLSYGRPHWLSIGSGISLIKGRFLITPWLDVVRISAGSYTINLGSLRSPETSPAGLHRGALPRIARPSLLLPLPALLYPVFPEPLPFSQQAGYVLLPPCGLLFCHYRNMGEIPLPLPVFLFLPLENDIDCHACHLAHHG